LAGTKNLELKILKIGIPQLTFSVWVMFTILSGLFDWKYSLGWDVAVAGDESGQTEISGFT